MNTATITMEDDDFFQKKNMGYMPRTQQPTSYTKCIQNAKFELRVKRFSGLTFIHCMNSLHMK